MKVIPTTLQIRYVKKESEWRVSDLKPQETFLYAPEENKPAVPYVILSVGSSTHVELHVPDDYRMVPSDEGAKKRKYFAFCFETCTVEALQGTEKITPIEITCTING